MDGTIVNVAVYLTATFAAALVTGVAGFAFGLVAAAVWLHILTPIQTATLIITFGLVVQGISVWKLRHALRWSRLWPFLLGAGFGVPLGVAILGWARPDYVRVTVGVVLVLYSAYSLARPAMKPVKAGGVYTAKDKDGAVEHLAATRAAEDAVWLMLACKADGRLAVSFIHSEHFPFPLKPVSLVKLQSNNVPTALIEAKSVENNQIFVAPLLMRHIMPLIMQDDGLIVSISEQDGPNARLYVFDAAKRHCA